MLNKCFGWLMPKLYFAEGEGDGVGGGAGTGKETVTIDKTEFDSLKGTVETLQQELNDTQASLLEPEYLEWKSGRGKSGARSTDDGTGGVPTTPQQPTQQKGDFDPFKDFTDEQLENMSPRQMAKITQQALSQTLVPAIVTSLKDNLIPVIKKSLQSEQDAADEQKAIAELKQLVKEGKNVKAVKDEMGVIADLNPNWDVRKVYESAVKHKRASIIAEGRELSTDEKKQLALGEAEKPTGAGGGSKPTPSEKTFKTNEEAAEDAYAQSFKE